MAVRRWFFLRQSGDDDKANHREEENLVFMRLEHAMREDQGGSDEYIAIVIIVPRESKGPDEVERLCVLT